MMEDPILAEFEDLIALQEDAAAAAPPAADRIDNNAEDDSTISELRPMDASSLSAHELDLEVREKYAHQAEHMIYHPSGLIH